VVVRGSKHLKELIAIPSGEQLIRCSGDFLITVCRTPSLVVQKSQAEKTPVSPIRAGANAFFPLEKRGMEQERRTSPRYKFVAEAQVIEVESDTTLRARTNDLSIGGCFLDTLHPLPKGTEIQVRIVHADAVFMARGRVVFVVPNMGMGVAFTNVDGNQAAVIQRWVSVVMPEMKAHK
jgi:hypothetical protein